VTLRVELIVLTLWVLLTASVSLDTLALDSSQTAVSSLVILILCCLHSLSIMKGELRFVRIMNTRQSATNSLMRGRHKSYVASSTILHLKTVRFRLFGNEYQTFCYCVGSFPVRDGRYGPGTVPMILDEFTCLGTEGSLFGDESCTAGQSQEMAVRCNGKPMQ